MQNTSIQARRSRRNNRGFTLPELIGAIIVIGIISAVATVQVLNANTQARENAKYGNAQALNRLVVAASAGGATIAAGGGNNIDTTTNLTAIAKLNTGFTVSGITYQMTPVIQTPASYPMSGTAPQITFTYTAGAAAAP